MLALWRSSMLGVLGGIRRALSARWHAHCSHYCYHASNMASLHSQLHAVAHAAPPTHVHFCCSPLAGKRLCGRQCQVQEGGIVRSATRRCTATAALPPTAAAAAAALAAAAAPAVAPAAALAQPAVADLAAAVMDEAPAWTLDQAVGLVFGGLLLLLYLSSTQVDRFIARGQRRQLGLCEECGGLFQPGSCTEKACPARQQQQQQ